MIRSTSSKRVRTPSYVLHGRTCAYRSSALRSPTLTERKPPPTGVVIGPLIATPVRRIDSSVVSGSGLPPCWSITSAPACWTSHSNSTPVASTTRRVASMSSGPVPSPGIRVTAWAMRAAMLASVKQRPQFARHPLRLALEPSPGEPDHPVAGDEQRGVAGTVALEGGARLAVELVAVELRDQSFAGPQRVDGEPGDGDVYRRHRHAVAVAEREKSRLEHRPGVDQRRAPVGEEVAEHLEAVPAVAARAGGLQRHEVEQPQPLRFVEGPLDVARPNDLREVEERAGDGGDRDAVVDGAVVRVQRAHAVDVDFRTRAHGPRRDHVDLRARGLPKTPERSGVPIAEHRAGPAREHGGHAMAVGAQAT